MFVLENNIECCFRAIEYSVYCDFWSLIFVNLGTTDRFSLWCIWSQWTIMIYIMTGANPPTYALHPQSTSCQQSSKSKYLSIFKIPGNLCTSVVVNMQYAKTINLIIIEFIKSIFDSRNLCICVVVVNMQCQLISLCPATVCVSHFKWCWYLLPPRSSSDTQMTHKHNGRPAHLYNCQ